MHRRNLRSVIETRSGPIAIARYDKCRRPLTSRFGLLRLSCSISYPTTRTYNYPVPCHTVSFALLSHLIRRSSLFSPITIHVFRLPMHVMMICIRCFLTFALRNLLFSWSSCGKLKCLNHHSVYLTAPLHTHTCGSGCRCAA